MMASRRSRNRRDKRAEAAEMQRTDDHVPDNGPMSVIPWSATTAYQFCSCGTWHLCKLADEARTKLARKP